MYVYVKSAILYFIFYILLKTGFTSFGEAWKDQFGVPLSCGVNAGLGGNHGFHPDKGPRPPFIGYGSDFLSGVVLAGAEFVDGAPTYAKLLGVDLPDADDKVLENLLRKE